MQTILLFAVLVISASHAATIAIVKNAPSPMKQGLLYLLPEPTLYMLVDPSKPLAEPDMSEWLAPQKNCVQFSPHDHVNIRLELTNITRQGLDKIRLE